MPRHTEGPRAHGEDITVPSQVDLVALATADGLELGHALVVAHLAHAVHAVVLHRAPLVAVF